MPRPLSAPYRPFFAPLGSFWALFGLLSLGPLLARRGLLSRFCCRREPKGTHCACDLPLHLNENNRLLYLFRVVLGWCEDQGIVGRKRGGCPLGDMSAGLRHVSEAVRERHTGAGGRDAREGSSSSSRQAWWWAEECDEGVSSCNTGSWGACWCWVRVEA